MESINGKEVVPPSSSIGHSNQSPKPTYANITKTTKPTDTNITKSHSSSNHTALFWETMQPVLQHKIPYWNDRETRGDGNCFFNAIIDQTHNNPGVYGTLSNAAKQCSTPSELRKAVVIYIKTSPDILENEFYILGKMGEIEKFRERSQDPTDPLSGKFPNFVTDEAIWTWFLGCQITDGTFAEEFTIQWTPSFLGKDIFYTTKENKNIWNRIPSTTGTHGVPITLSSNQTPDLNTGQHFQSIIPLADPGSCRSCARQGLKSIKSHFVYNKHCKQMYDMSIVEAESKANSRKRSRESSARYNTKNRDQIQKKQAEYDSKHREQIQKKQAEYNSQHREQIHEKQAEYNSQHREQIQVKQAEYNSEHREQIRKRQAEYDSNNRAAKIARFSAAREHLAKNQTAMGRIEAFRKAQRDGFVYVCISCHRLFFKIGVDSLESRYWKNNLPLLDPLKVHNDENFAGKNLCKTCGKYLKAHKLPPMCFKNGLGIETMPHDLQLSELEAVLCSKKILFAKIHTLPKSTWSGSKGKVVNVPLTSDKLRETFDKITTFPRQPIDGGIISVKLKRRLCYKKPYLPVHWIHPKKVVNAAIFYKESGHPQYQNIDIDENYTPKISIDVPVPDSAKVTDKPYESLKEAPATDNNSEKVTTENSGADENPDNESGIGDIDEDSDEDLDDDRLEAVEKNQFDLDQHYVMANDHPESMFVSSSSKGRKDLNIAPGEGFIPSSLMRDDTWDIDSFPQFHPSGQYGLNHPRDVKLSHRNYFLQRLQNINPQFRKSKSYLFAALYYLERQQFEQRINISCQRGTMDGNELTELTDPMNVFDEVRGTPKYWQKRRKEIIAKIKQLGPFQFFFTLSCADKRWNENFLSILSQRGHKITFEKSGSVGCPVGDSVNVLVDEIPLQTFLEKHMPELVRGGIHTLIKENVYTITKIFDRRVRNFINQIIKGKNSPMVTLNFHYRIEFQSRGAGHAHGVLWLDLPELDTSFPGIKAIFKSISKDIRFNDLQIGILQKFIDKFISCSLEDPNVSGIVKEVQIHHHTQTCRKYGSKCRFGYPKFPSEETIIAQPLDPDNFPSEEHFKDHEKRLQDALERVKFVLENMDIRYGQDKFFTEHLIPKITIDDILEHAGISKDLRNARTLYYEALKTSKKGKIIILQRTVQEVWVNNYNPEWILAWNGNMDIQLCLDFYAICTYITDYYTKDETGTLGPLLEAARELHGKTQKEKMKALANVFSSHRSVGESEAYYKLFQELHLSHSSVTVKSVMSGFPHKRNVFLRKVLDDDENESGEGEEQAESKFITLKDNKNKYVKPPSDHEKYAARPDSLEHVCFAQFLMWYESSRSNAKEPKNANAISTQEIICPHLDNPAYLPKYIKMKDPRLRPMYLRQSEKVLMLHQYKEAENPHEFFYSELLLYRHWRNEGELHGDDLDACIEYFQTKLPNNPSSSFIDTIKEQLFPEKNDVELAFLGSLALLLELSYHIKN